MLLLIRNNVIREIINAKFRFRLHKIQLNWYGHVQRMDEERLPRKKLKWCPTGRRRKGRPRNSWMLEVTTGMREKGINNLELLDREE